MIDQVRDIVNDAKGRFRSWVKIYRPWEGDNHTTERNLSFQFAPAFLDLHHDALVFTEVPFKDDKGPKSNKHLDTYLYSQSSGLGLLLESKNAFGQSHLPKVVADMKRMNNFLVAQINKRHKGLKPQSTHGVILIETWYRHMATWWIDPQAEGRWQGVLDPRPPDWTFDVAEVLKDGKDTLFWLYGVSPNLQ
jgi:hypothetical protein